MSVLAFRGAVPRRGAPSDQHLRHGGGLAVRDRAALDPARSDPARSGLDGGAYTARSTAGHRHAHRAQARHDDLSLGARSGRSASAASPCAQELRRRRAVRARVRDPELSRGARAEVRARVRSELLSLHLARHGSLRSRRRTAARMSRCWRSSQLEQALVIGVESDMLFAIAEQRALAEDSQGRRHHHALRAARLHRRARLVPDRLSSASATEIGALPRSGVSA